MLKIELKNIIKVLMLSIAMLLVTNMVIAQDQEEEAVVSDDDEGKLPVRNPWTTGALIDNQTTEGPNKGIFEYAILHRFGKIKEMNDLFGIYAASNIKMAVAYGITEKISIGFGTEKNNKMQEFTGKYKIISQTRNGKIPVSVTYFGNVVIDAREKEFFGEKYEFTNRLSFFNQLIIGRKFTNALSLQVGASFSHFNAVTELVKNPSGQTIGKWKNDYIGLMAGGRYKFYNNMSAVVEYCHPFAINEAWVGQSEPLANLGIGLEIGTSTHAFQVFAANYDNLIPQKNYSNNLNDMVFEGWRFGFNIIVRF
jgi:hypothetical protein